MNVPTFVKVEGYTLNEGETITPCQQYINLNQVVRFMFVDKNDRNICIILTRNSFVESTGKMLGCYVVHEESMKIINYMIYKSKCEPIIDQLVTKMDELTMELQYHPQLGSQIRKLKEDYENLAGFGNSFSTS